MVETGNGVGTKDGLGLGMCRVVSTIGEILTVLLFCVSESLDFNWTGYWTTLCSVSLLSSLS